MSFLKIPELSGLLENSPVGAKLRGEAKIYVTEKDYPTFSETKIPPFISGVNYFQAAKFKVCA